MGIFDFLFKKKKDDYEDKLVTQAVDPSTISDEELKKAEDALKVIEEVLAESEDSTLAEDNPTTARNQVFDIKNPFVGE